MFDEQPKTTTMQDAFARAGVSKAEMEFHAACRKVRHANVSFDDALAVLRRVYGRTELRSEGPSGVAKDGQNRCAQTPQTSLPGKGQPPTAQAGQARIADARQPDRERMGRSPNAKTGRMLNAQPAREPTSVQRAARIQSRAKTLTIMDTYRVRGHIIGNLTMARVGALRQCSAQEAALLDQIRKHVANAEPFQLVRDVIKVKELQAFIQRAAELSDAA